MKKLIYSLGALTFVSAIALTSCKKPADPGFTAAPSPAKVGENITFTDNEAERKNASYVWEFGDGTRSYDRVATHAYWTPGTYNAYQIVSNNKNAEKGKGLEKNSAVTVITITGPTASFTASSASVAVNQPVTFTNTSTDAGVYMWSYMGDNGMSWNGGSTTNKNLTLTFSAAGKYMVYLNADVKGSMGTSSANATPVEITVTGAPSPTANAAVRGMLYGKWTFVSDNIEVAGNSSATGPCLWPANGIQPANPLHSTITFNDNNTVWLVDANGNQTTGSSGTWGVDATGSYVMMTVLALPLGGTYHIENISATALTLKVKEICTAEPLASRTRILIMSK